MRSDWIECSIGDSMLKLGYGASLSRDTKIYLEDGLPSANETSGASWASSIDRLLEDARMR